MRRLPLVLGAAACIGFGLLLAAIGAVYWSVVWFGVGIGVASVGLAGVVIVVAPSMWRRGQAMWRGGRAFAEYVAQLVSPRGVKGHPNSEDD